MITLNNFFSEFRKMSGGSLQQVQVDNMNDIIDNMGIEVAALALGIEDEKLLTVEKLRKIYPSADVEFVDIINTYASQFEINTKRRMALFLAHTLHESLGYTRLAESFNYKPQRLRDVFPSRIPSVQFAANLISQGQPAIANFLYGGRYGNGSKNNDGWDYRGRGVGHLTFKDNYSKMQGILNDMGIEYDIVKSPELLSKKIPAVGTFMAFWKHHNLNDYADKNMVTASTKVINGGYNGVKDRISLYNKASAVL